jgi:hypothetical protein
MMPPGGIHGRWFRRGRRPSSPAWAAIAYSVIGSCRLNGLDPVRYLTDIAPHLADDRFGDHAAITPRAWAAKRRAVAAA